MGPGDQAASVMLSDSQRAILTAVCDTVVPSLPRDRDPDGLWARKASDLGVDQGAAQLIAEIPDPELQGGLLAADRCDRRPGDRPGTLPGVPRADTPEHGALGPAGGRRRRGADRDDALPPLRGAGSGDRPESKLEGVRLPGADLRAATGREAASHPRAGGLRGDPRGRRLRRRLGVRRSCGRGGAGGARSGRRRPRGRRLLQRVRLRPARAEGLPGDVLARRARPDRRRQRQPGRRDHSRRRHHDQLDQLPAHAPVGP